MTVMTLQIYETKKKRTVETLGNPNRYPTTAGSSKLRIIEIYLQDNKTA